MRIHGLFVYPVKSCGPSALTRMELDRAGPCWDREWMVIDADGRFLTQREEPRMALVRTALAENALLLRADGHGELRVPLAPPAGAIVQATVWNDTVPAHVEDSRFFSDFFHRPLRLVRISAAGRKTGADKRPVRFADSSALNLASRSSLADLNARLKEPVEMLRFRPNVVIEGAPPWAEDSWESFTAGGSVFARRKPTTRCSITAVDASTGTRRGPEPMKTLATFRRNAAGQVEFAQHFFSCDGAELAVGMEITAR